MVNCGIRGVVISHMTRVSLKYCVFTVSSVSDRQHLQGVEHPVRLKYTKSGVSVR